MSAKRAGDRLSEEQLGREILKLRQMQNDAGAHGAHYQVILGMIWALEWASHRGASPTYVLETVTSADDAKWLAAAHDQLLARIDLFMANQGERLFGE
jgi:hypothetical protein